MVPFYHFHSSSNFFIKFSQTLLSTHLTLSSLKINKEKIQTSKSCNFIGHNIFSAHMPIQHPLYITTQYYNPCLHIVEWWPRKGLGLDVVHLIILISKNGPKKKSL